MRIAGLVALALVLAGALAPLTARADVDKPAVERAFRTWLETEIWPQSQKDGVSRATFERAFAGVSLDWSLPELAPPGEVPGKLPTHTQAEFGSAGAYFKDEGIDINARQGMARIEKLKPTLQAIEKRFGVPYRFLVALWARESSYGREVLKYPAVRTIATEAFIGFRKDYFKPELLAALRILQNGDVTLDRMKSSWAGALGQPQLLPTGFEKHAVDFDGDGRRDIWTSEPDVLASIAHLLQAAGWKPDRGWGIEVDVPETVSCTLEGPDQGRPLAEWNRMGIKTVDGKTLPAIAKTGQTFLLMPAGRHGPAFIVTDNFYILKAYNFSDLYALYVAHLSDRFTDNQPFATGWEPVGVFKRDDVKKMQDRLVAQGYDVGKADGLVGYKSRIAIGKWQAKNDQPATCYPDAELIAQFR